MKIIFTFIFIIYFVNPLQAKERGETIFLTLCASCHGQKGEGNKSLDTPKIASLPGWYIKNQIKNFTNGARGLHPHDSAGMKMRPMARSINNENTVGAVDDVIQYMDTLANTATKITVKGDILAGRKKFKDLACFSCHGTKAEGNKALNAPPLKNLDDWYMVTQLNYFKNGIRGANAQLDPHGATMAAMAKSLSETDIKNVVSYIKALK